MPWKKIVDETSSSCCSSWGSLQRVAQSCCLPVQRLILTPARPRWSAFWALSWPRSLDPCQLPRPHHHSARKNARLTPLWCHIVSAHDLSHSNNHIWSMNMKQFNQGRAFACPQFAKKVSSANRLAGGQPIAADVGNKIFESSLVSLRNAALRRQQCVCSRHGRP